MSDIARLWEASARHLPPDERRDVSQAIAQQLLGGVGRADYMAMDEALALVADLETHQEQFAKGVALQSFISGTAKVGSTTVPGARHKSILYINELGVLGPGLNERWSEKPVTGGLEFLKYMSSELDLHRALVLTRQRQVHAFLRLYREDDTNPLGYRWTRRDGERLTDYDQRETRRLDRVLFNSGTEDDPDERQYVHRRRTFPAFIDVLINDTLTADACPVERVRGEDGRLLGWHNIPLETVRLAHEDGFEGDERIVGIQLHPTTRVPIYGYTKHELIYQVRNPRADLGYGDYGQCELEHFVRAATSYLNTFEYNASFLSRKSLPRGFLTIFGDFDRRQLNHWKTQWNNAVRGAVNAWNLPVLVSRDKKEGGATFTAIDQQTQEMFQTKWLIFLASVLCALYGMDPVELNLEAFSSKVSSLSGKDTAEKLQSSKDRGFIPLMHWLENFINEHLIRNFTQRYQLTWVGLFPADEDRKAARQDKVLIVDEMRAIDGEEPHRDPDIGAAPVNPTLMSLHVMKVQQRLQQEQMAAAGGAPGGGDDDAHFGLPGSEQPLLPSGLRAGTRPTPGVPPAGGQTARPPASAATNVGERGAQRHERGPGASAMAKAAAVPKLRVEIRELQPGDVW